MGRKKFRDIIVDNEKWAWGCTQKDYYYRSSNLKIWKDKKLKYSLIFDGEHKIKRYQLTPRLISRFIKLYLK